MCIGWVTWAGIPEMNVIELKSAGLCSLKNSQGFCALPLSSSSWWLPELLGYSFTHPFKDFFLLPRILGEPLSLLFP